MLVLQFWKSYIPKSDITLDEQLVSLGRRSSFCQESLISTGKSTKENKNQNISSMRWWTILKQNVKI